ncbi:helix-turn-helix domain-containing protein [Amycolatopsis jiangsuensis]|uniref:Transcriptional regulator with XRE-family HTH domain n=1 Tax=Amycolatopsis jiangsuensis TaxID=1181879 RepID=A0A840IPL7_9PSEU|nr:helix-turn-helix transcriptional regulator [Amycolatopsis jiangsuensis]MBB4683307.1 transcriptional regulator with XRE-family HTH domain [Amycolatopsis jiangsuensis]
MPSTDPPSRARALGAALRGARLEARLGLPELARRIDVEPRQLADWESGRRVPGIEHVAGLLGALGVTGADKAWILSLAKGAAGPGWLVPGPQADPVHFTTLVAHERAARSITVWAPVLVPDLLQIRDYTRFAGGVAPLRAGELEWEVDQRMGRRDVLFGCRAVPAEMFIGAEALRDHFGDDDVMLRQLRFLADVLVMSRTIDVRIVAGGAAHGGAFTVFRMADSVPVVYCPHHGAAVFLVDDQAVPYSELAGRLRETALSPRDSHHRLTTEADRLSRVLETRRSADDAALTEILERGDRT